MTKSAETTWASLEIAHNIRLLILSPRTFRYILETFLRRPFAICRQQSQPSESFDSRHWKATVREMRANEYESFSRVCVSHYITNVLPVVFDISRLESYTNFDALTLKTPSKLVADDILELIFYYFYFFSEKIKLDISCESSADDSHEMPSLICSEKS